MKVTLFLVASLCLCGDRLFAGTWELQSPLTLASNSLTTLTLVSKTTPSGNRRVWIDAIPPNTCIVPDQVEVIGDKLEIPVFVRSEASRLLLLDEIDDTASTITLPVLKSKGCQATVAVSALDALPVMYANLPTTLTLNLKGGVGEQPRTAHVTLQDASGRRVFSRFYNTFDLLGGLATMRVTSPGFYELRATLLQEPVTSMPRSLLRDAMLVPYGVRVEDLPGLPQTEDGVTTQLVMGSVIALENIPSTATVMSEDRLPIAVFSGMSNESKLNKWPFAIDSRATIDLENFNVRSAIIPLNLQQMVGSGFAPVSLNWSRIQTGPESFRWDSLDTILKTYRSYKIRPILSISGLAGWDRKKVTETSSTQVAWINMLREVGKKYRKLIWGFQVSPTCGVDLAANVESDTYRNLIEASWEGFLKQEDGTVAPGPPLIMDSGNPLDFSYLDSVLTSHTASRLNAIAFNFRPTGEKASPEQSHYPDLFQQARQFTMSHNLVDPKLYLSGFEWNAGPHGVSEFEQANFLTRTHVYAAANSFYKITYGSLSDYSTSGGLRQTGLFHADFTPRPASVAYNISAFMLSGTSPVAIRQQGKATIFEFNIAQQSNKWSGRLYVAWTNSPGDREVISLTMTLGGGYYIQDYLGREISSSTVNKHGSHQLTGPINVTASYEPLFIWDAGKPPGLQNGTPKSIE